MAEPWLWLAAGASIVLVLWAVSLALGATPSAPPVSGRVTLDLASVHALMRGADVTFVNTPDLEGTVVVSLGAVGGVAGLRALVERVEQERLGRVPRDLTHAVGRPCGAGPVDGRLDALVSSSSAFVTCPVCRAALGLEA